jgi:hypothetical protein
MGTTMKITSTEIIKVQDATITKMKIKPPDCKFYSERMLFGLDPGTVHMGFAQAWRSFIYIYEIEMKRNPDAVQRIIDVHTILSACSTWFDYAPLAVIEGASFGSTHRQVELAEIRTSAVWWFKNHNATVKIVPPKTIRKLVFESGNVKAEDVWTELPANSAAALACAYSGSIRE